MIAYVFRMMKLATFLWLRSAWIDRCKKEQNTI